MYAQRTLQNFLTHRDLDQDLVVLHTRPRCEKKLQVDFDTQDIPVYFPVEHRTRFYGSRERSFQVPLFGGYVFALVSDLKEAWVKQNQYVSNYLSVRDEDELLTQLHQIETALNLGSSTQIYNYLVEGERVKIRSGPMKGVEGVIETVGKQHHIVLNIELIQQSVSMVIDPTLLVPVE